MNFTDAYSFASMVVERAGASADYLNQLPWLARVDTLYHVMRAQRMQGLPACYARAALILWEVVATDELLVPEVGAAMREMTFVQLCEVVYELSQFKGAQFAPWLNERVALAA